MKTETEQIGKIVDESKKIVVVQADNPDIDSLASALALESILGDRGKEVILYCGVDIPSYLHYLPGWARIQNEMPNHFDASIIVDTNSDTLLEQLDKSGARGWLASRPTIVIDHHSTRANINYADVMYTPKAVATGEAIYDLANSLGWEIGSPAKPLIAMAILSDSLGLMSEATTARSIGIIAELVEQGVNLPELENARRESIRREPELVHYKGELLKRVEFYDDDRVAVVHIPHAEIERYSPLYNPPMLVLDDMRLAKNTAVAIAFKTYRDGKTTAKIRANYGWGIAGDLAEHFGGGGHPYASGFKITDGRSYEDVKSATIKLASEMLTKIESKRSNEAL